MSDKCIDCIHVVSCEFDHNAANCNQFEEIPNVCAMDEDEWDESK